MAVVSSARIASWPDIGDVSLGGAVDDQVGGVDACFGKFVGGAGRLGQRRVCGRATMPSLRPDESAGRCRFGVCGAVLVKAGHRTEAGRSRARPSRKEFHSP
jgi:hypothetical protein